MSAFLFASEEGGANMWATLARFFSSGIKRTPEGMGIKLAGRRIGLYGLFRASEGFTEISRHSRWYGI